MKNNQTEYRKILKEELDRRERAIAWFEE